MVRKMVCAVFAAVMLLGLSVQAKAAEGLGTLRITLEDGETGVTEGEKTLYFVGERTSEGYRLTEEFGGGFVKEVDAMSLHLGNWLAQTAEGATPRILDADGSAEFSYLPEGLYLLVQSETAEGYYPIEPFLLTLPFDGRWYIQAYPIAEKIPSESPKTGQSIVPYLGIFGMVFSGGGLVLCAAGKRKK